MITSAPGTSPHGDHGILWTRLPDIGPLRPYEATVPDGLLRAMLSREPQGWHLSVSFRPNDSEQLRLPSWDELKDARYRFVPDRANMAALLPPRAEWVDIHPTCLHLWEIPAETGM